MANGFFEQVWAEFGPEATVKAATEFAPRLIAAVFATVLVFIFLRLAARGVDAVAKRADLDQTLTTFVKTVVRYVIYILGLLSVLGQLGVDVSSILTSLGVVGLTIGFAARDTLSNLISGLFILWDRPFVIGDLIEIGGNYGRVDSITLRSTRVVTVDGKMLAIPNTEIVNSTVASYTNFPHLRIDIDFTVGLNEDFAKLRALFADELTKLEGFQTDRPVQVMLKDAGDYCLTVQFRVWIEDETKHITKRFELREALFERMRNDGVEMPYETIQLAPFEHRGPSTAKAA